MLTSLRIVISQRIILADKLHSDFSIETVPPTPVFKKHVYATYFFPSWKQLIYAGSKRKLKQFRLIMIIATVIFEH